jgi:hypothetical protein
MIHLGIASNSKRAPLAYPVPQTHAFDPPVFLEVWSANYTDYEHGCEVMGASTAALLPWAIKSADKIVCASWGFSLSIDELR